MDVPMSLCSPLRACRQRGFSYLWVLFLVAFLGVGLTVAVEIEATATQRDKEKELIAIGRQFRTAIGRYWEIQLPDNRHEYPATLGDLLEDKRLPGVKRHLRKLFVDPMTGQAEWGIVRVGGRIVAVHSLSEKAPIKQDGFEAEDMDLRGKQKYSEWVFAYPFDVMLRTQAGANTAADLSGRTAGNDLGGREESKR